MQEEKEDKSVASKSSKTNPSESQTEAEIQALLGKINSSQEGRWIV